MSDSSSSYTEFDESPSSDDDDDQDDNQVNRQRDNSPMPTRRSQRVAVPRRRYCASQYDSHGRFQGITKVINSSNESKAIAFLTQCEKSHQNRKLELFNREYIYHTILAADAPEVKLKDDPARYRYKDAFFHPTQWRKWRESMDDEKRSWLVNDIWEMIECPKDVSPIDCRWVYRLKYNPDRSIARYKSRLVAKGYTQQYTIDYNETFAPVAKYPSIRLLFSIAATKRWKAHQMDVKTAFLCSEIDTDVYVRVPDGLEIPPDRFRNPVMKLKKGLYGLKQAPRLWYERLSQALLALGFVRSDYDHSIFIKENLIIAVYVDDILLSGEPEKIVTMKKKLAEEFEMVDGSPVNYFLGIQIYDLSEEQDGFDGYALSQSKYIADVLEEFHMDDCRPVSTPIDKLQSKRTNDDAIFDQKTYQKAVGSLMYLMLGTRPDIAFAISHLAQFCSDPAEKHWIAIKRVFRYLKGTAHHCLYLSPSRQAKFCDKINSTIHGYTDADWGASFDRKSVGGYEFYFNGCLVSWSSRKQTFVATSTMEAEYMAAANATKEAIWIANLTHKLNAKAHLNVISENRPVKLLCDNQAAIRVSKNPEDHKRSKHIDLSFHFLRQRVELGQVDLQYVSTQKMAADYLTKPLAPAKFLNCRNMSGIFHHSNFVDEEEDSV